MHMEFEAYPYGVCRFKTLVTQKALSKIVCIRFFSRHARPFNILFVTGPPHGLPAFCYGAGGAWWRDPNRNQGLGWWISPDAVLGVLAVYAEMRILRIF